MVEDTQMSTQVVGPITVGFLVGAVLAYYLVSHKQKTGTWV